MLSEQDKKDVKEIVDYSIENHPKINKMQRNLDTLNEDVGGLKQDVGGLKQDVRVLKEDVRVLKEDVRVLKEDVSVLKEDVSILKKGVSRQGVLMEDMASKIQLILENTQQNNEKIVRIDDHEERITSLETRQSATEKVIKASH